MGVPKFFRYISERYPCLSELVRDNQIPEFDNLYLDMNGIIHVCSHPNDFDPHFRMTEEKMFKDITHYIEILFHMIQPQKLFFMAIDGVAPRAKMNQQRGRRFRSAREAETLEKAAKAKGEILPSEARFDSNCITPGTEFMVRLQDHLKYFVKSKITTDELWRKCRIVLSGHETPGEGEHKIMEFIRFMKSKPNYNPDTRHCLYGLDADLIMLGLCSHEPHFSLLREEVKFGKQANKRTATAEETSFYLLHLSLLREYLEQEFCHIKSTLPFKYDLENIIDDWVLMGFMVGNDFIPHLPNLHINSNALPLLYDTYMNILPTLDGYINEGGKLNLPRLEEFMKRLAKIDRDFFDEINADLQYFDSKRGDNPWLPERKVDNAETFDVDVTAIKASGDLQALIQATEDMFADVGVLDSDSDNEASLNIPRVKPQSDELTREELFDQEFKLYKRDYYITKLGYKEVDDSVLAEQAECYVRALQWTLLYYYRGVGSWCWFYPHHYAPFISDIKDFKHLKLEFEMGKPFLPFQQLLAVLPSASRTLLPEAYRNLMTSTDSPVIHYYPTDFETDLNGKKQDWEAVVLIPFIEEDLLIKSMTECESMLTLEEISRNIHGPMLQYDYTTEDQGLVEGPQSFPNLSKNFAKETEVYRADVAVPEEKLVLGIPAAAKLDVYFPGFPTLKHLNYTSRINKGGVKVFEHPSRNENMIIEISPPSSESDIVDVATDLLGKSVFVAWPHLREARVESVSDMTKRYYLNSNGSLNTEENTGNLLQLWKSHKQTATDHYMNRLGIDIGDTNILLHVNLLEGRKYVFGNQGRITLEKQFSKIQSVYALQASVKDITVHDTSFIQFKSIEEIFPVNKIVFMIGQPYYGSMGNVIDANPKANKGRVKVNLIARPEPNLSFVEDAHRAIISQYMNGYEAASKVGISNNILGRVTGTVYVVPGEKQFRPQLETTKKINVGLNLKLTKRNEELSGYCRRVGNTWLYSPTTVQLLRDYSEKYPKLFEMLGKGSYNDIFYESDLFPNEVGTGKLEELNTWLKEQPFSKAERRPCGSEAVDKTIIPDIKDAVQFMKKQHSRNVVIYLKPLYLYTPGLQARSLPPDTNAVFKMFDRVICVRQSYTVPIGRKGTVIAMHKVQDPNPVHQNNSGGDLFLDVLFDEPFLGGGAYEDVAENCVYRVPPTVVLNISHGIRSENNAKKVSSPKKASPLNKNVSQDNPYNIAVKGGFKDGRNIQPNSVLQAQLAQDIQPLSNAAGPVIYNSNNIEPPQQPINFQAKLWEDLLNKQQNKTHLNQQMPVNNSIDDSTEMLKKVLGVNSNLPFSPPKPTATPVEIKLNVEDIFSHARANKAAAAAGPVLPQPPQQWYGGKKEMPSPNQNWPNRPIIQQNENKKMHQKNSPKANHQNPTGASSKSPHAPQQQHRVQHHINLRQQMTMPQYPNRYVLSDSMMADGTEVLNHMIRPQENLMQGLVCNKPNQNKSHSNKTNKQNKQSATGTDSSSFIPLQAIKKERLRNHSTSQEKEIVQPYYQCQPPQIVPTIAELESQIRQETNKKRQIIQQKQEEGQQQFQKYLQAGQQTDANAVQSPEKKPEEKQRKRKSRIAANFAGLQ